MRKLVLLFFVLLMLGACSKFRVQHDHSQKMESVRVPVDTAQRDYVDEERDDSWMDDPIMEVPEETGHVSSSSDPGDEIERFMRGEDVQ